MKYTGALIVFILLNSVKINFSLRLVSGDGKNVNVDPKIGDFFPDWVPFKNKNSEELFEFAQVQKPTPKKRLALPLNFFMKAVADSESSDDYYEKNQGESGDDYEKSDWSDLNRETIPLTDITKVNHTDLIDIDGIPPQDIKDIKPYVHINVITEKINTNSENKTEEIQRNRLNSETNENKYKNLEPYKVVEPYKEVKRAKKKLYEEFDYDDKSPEAYKIIDKNDEVKALNEYTKLDEIQEKHAPLQRKHSDRDTERANEDERLKEELETELFLAQQLYGKTEEKIPESLPFDNSNNKYEEHGDILVGKYDSEIVPPPTIPTTSTSETFSNPPKIKYMEKDTTTTPKTVESIFENPSLYLEETDEKENETASSSSSSEEISANNTSNATKQNVSSESSEIENEEKKEKEKENEREKEIEEEKKKIIFEQVEQLKREHEAEQRRIRNRERKLRKSGKTNLNLDKYESKSTTQATTRYPKINYYLPEDDTANAEPVLFFPKRNKKKRKSTTSRTSKLESSRNSLFGVTSTDTVPSASDTKLASSNTAPSGPFVDTHPSSAETSSSSIETGPAKAPISPKPDSTSSESFERPGTGDSAASAPSEPSALTSAPSASDAAVSQTNSEIDTVPAATDQKKGGGDHAHEKGGGKEYYSSAEEEHGEHGKKAYQGKHEDTKTAKGKHDKEDHLGKYEDHGGHKKHHHDESGHFGVHHHEEKGKKHAKYEESGKHSKGHNTKGSHDIHKKEEYEKKVEFFEEEGDFGEEEKHGGYKKDNEHEKAGKFHHGNHAAGHAAHHKGTSGHHLKGHLVDVNKGYKHAEGHDNHGKHEEGHHKKDGVAEGKKWVYHHGHPAKTANLVVIDRGDFLQRGPVLFGRF